MKKINFNVFLFLPLIILMLFTSCQDEETEIINPTNEETIIPNSNLASLILNTATRDGSFDNIIDFANCLSVELPVTIIVNGITLTINSVEDFDAIEAILEQFENDTDEIEIQFPIVIILSNYDEIIINNQEELEVFIEECSGENEEDDDIECIDFQYPITISIYNTDFQVIDTIIINSDEELYMFIENLEGGVLASLNFPVTMVLANGETIEVNNNEELEIAISEAIDDCDEDDDNDYDDDDEYDCPDLEANVGDVCENPNGVLGVLNADCECEIDDTNFDCPDLQANVGDSCLDNENGEGVINANCECEVDDTNFDCPDLQANVGDDCLNPSGMLGVVNANCECEVDDTTFDCPELQANVGDVCVTSTGDLGIVNADCGCEPRDTCSEQDVDAYLLECVWYVVSFNGDDNLITFEFDFNNDGTVIITGDNQVITAMWSTSEGGSGVILEFGNVNGSDIQAITGNWVIVECNSGRLEMFRDNDLMVMEQDCN